MNTGIKDKNGIEIYVGDKVIRRNRVDNSEWEVTFGKFKAIVNNTVMSINTFILVDKHGFQEVMENKIYWQYSHCNDDTEYEIIK